MLCGLMYWSLYPIINHKKTVLYDIEYARTQYWMIEIDQINYCEIFSNALHFLCFSGIYLGSMVSIVLSFSYSQKAGVNEGIITSIWAITPVFSAILDYIAFSVKLQGRHLIGVITLIICATCISLSNITP